MSAAINFLLHFYYEIKLNKLHFTYPSTQAMSAHIVPNTERRNSSQSIMFLGKSGVRQCVLGEKKAIV